MKFVASIALILFTIASIDAQKRLIDKAEYDAVVTEGKRALDNKLRSKAHRITSSFAALSGGNSKPVMTVFETFEREGNGAARSRRSESVMGATRSAEDIWVNGSAYTRNGGKWSRESFGTLSPMARPSFGPENDGFSKKIISHAVEYFHLGSVRLEHEELEGYSSVETTKSVYEINGNDLVTSTTNTYYFRKDGTIARHDYRSTGLSLRNGARSEYRFIVNWEFGVMIIIIAPEIAP